MTVTKIPNQTKKIKIYSKITFALVFINHSLHGQKNLKMFRLKQSD